MKVLKILGIVLLVIVVILFIVDYVGRNFWAPYISGEGRVKVTINRNYSNQDEKKLIELAESIDCDISSLPKGSIKGWSSGLDGACVVSEDIKDWQEKEKELLAENDKSSNYVIDYNVYIDKNNIWLSGSDEFKDKLASSVVLDKNGNVSTLEECLASINNDYWVVVQKKDTSFGRPDKLAGSGVNSQRYLLFDKNFNFICQRPEASQWIN